MNSTTERRWTTAAADEIDWRVWDGDVVARVVLSGSTYLLGETASAAFTQLSTADRPLSVEELAERLFADVRDKSEQTRHETSRALEALLADLHSLNLARPSAP